MKHFERKTEILQQASLLFKEKGYSAVTMRDLAESLGIKAASLYNHISSKQEILSSIIISVAETFTKGMNEIVQKETSPVEKLRQIIAFHIDVTVQFPDELAALNNDWVHLEGELEYFLKMREDYEENFRRIIKEGIALGHIEPRNVEIMLFALLSTLRTLYLWYGKKGKVNVAQLKEEMTETLLKGIVHDASDNKNKL